MSDYVDRKQIYPLVSIKEALALSIQTTLEGFHDDFNEECTLWEFIQMFSMTTQNSSNYYQLLTTHLESGNNEVIATLHDSTYFSSCLYTNIEILYNSHVWNLVEILTRFHQSRSWYNSIKLTNLRRWSTRSNRLCLTQIYDAETNDSISSVSICWYATNSLVLTRWSGKVNQKISSINRSTQLIGLFSHWQVR